MKSTRTLLLALLFFAAASLVLAGCVPTEEEEQGNDEFSEAMPSAKPLSLDLPNDDASGALQVGERAEYYSMTRGVSLVVNGHVGVMLGTLKLITLLPASDSGENYRVWGPSEPKDLEPVSWMMRVDKVDDTLFTFSLDGRSKAAAEDEAFLPVVYGQVFPADDEMKSRGSLTLNFDNGQTIGTADNCSTGLVHVQWDGSGDSRTVEVEWENFLDTCKDEGVFNASYLYTQGEESGEFQFVTRANIHNILENKPGLETVTMNSRWLRDGTGQSDVVIEGEEISTDLTAVGIAETSVKASQCWDSVFNLTFADTLPVELRDFIFPEMGDITACPFEASYPQL